MRTVHAGASDAELVECLSEWSDLMAANDYARAADFLHPSAREADGVTWTADDLRSHISRYGAVTPTRDADRKRVAPHEVFRFRDPALLPEVEFVFPLNGQWSDLI